MYTEKNALEEQLVFSPHIFLQPNNSRKLSFSGRLCKSRHYKSYNARDRRDKSCKSRIRIRRYFAHFHGR